jgi:flagellar protein FliS
MNRALQQYRKVDAHGSVQDADPHRLIQMLFRGALDRVAAARGCIANGDVAGKGEQIGKAISIIGGLRDSLDLERGDLARQLDELYDYMGRRLLLANLHGDVALLDEVTALLTPLASAWDQVREQVVQTKAEAGVAS